MPKSLDDLRELLDHQNSAAAEEYTANEEKRSSSSNYNLTSDSDESEHKKARAKAMRLLEHMDRTEKGLYEKLKSAEFSERAIAEAMAYVKSYGYINDLRYAETYLRTRVESKSRQQLTLELLRKGVDKHTIDLAWDAVIELEEPDERSMIRQTVLKKYQPGTALDVKGMRRLYGQLTRKGFRGGDISSVLNELEITCDYSVEWE